MILKTKGMIRLFKQEALYIVQTITRMPFTSYVDYPIPSRFKLVAEKGIVTAKVKGPQKWGNVHYYDRYVKLVLDFPGGYLSEEELQETLQLPLSLKKGEPTGYYLKGKPGDEKQTLNIKLYGESARDEQILQRVVQAAKKVFDVMSCS